MQLRGVSVIAVLAVASLLFYATYSERDVSNHRTQVNSVGRAGAHAEIVPTTTMRIAHPEDGLVPDTSAKTMLRKHDNLVGLCCQPEDIALQTIARFLKLFSPAPEACAFMLSNDSLIYNPLHVSGQKDACLLADGWIVAGASTSRELALQPVFSLIVNIFNHEHTIERVLRQILKTTSETYELILFFDGCTDDSVKLALQLVDSYVGGQWLPCVDTNAVADPLVECKTNTGELVHFRAIVQPAGNSVYETSGNNVAMRAAVGKYYILMQDDMYMTEEAWNSRLAAGPRTFDDVVSVTAMCAHNMVSLKRRY